MKKYSLYILFASLLISCGSGRNRTAETETEVSPEENINFFVFDMEGGIAEGSKFSTFNELIDSISYIPLETHKDALLPQRYTFARIGDDMFVSGGTAVRPAPIYRFDSLGRFKEQMTYIGRGPGEVVMPEQWYVNSDLRQINLRISTFSTGAAISFTP